MVNSFFFLPLPSHLISHVLFSTCVLPPSQPTFFGHCMHTSAQLPTFSFLTPKFVVFCSDSLPPPPPPHSRPAVLLLSLHTFFLQPAHSLIFVVRKKGSKTKDRMKEEETEKGDCGPPTRKAFFFFTVGHLSPSPIENLDPVDDRGSAGEGASSAILFWGWSGRGGVSG